MRIHKILDFIYILCYNTQIRIGDGANTDFTGCFMFGPFEVFLYVMAVLFGIAWLAAYLQGRQGIHAVAKVATVACVVVAFVLGAYQVDYDLKHPSIPSMQPK